MSTGPTCGSIFKLWVSLTEATLVSSLRERLATGIFCSNDCLGQRMLLVAKLSLLSNDLTCLKVCQSWTGHTLAVPL